MNKFSRIAALIIATAAILGAVIYYAGQEMLFRESVEHASGNLNFTRKAIFAYAQDARKSGKSYIYPQTIQNLLNENYLNTGDIKELRSAGTVTYFQPPASISKDFIILEGKTDQFVLRCPLEGTIQVLRVK